MVTNQSSVCVPPFPNDLLAAVANEAADDADRVALFLTYLGIRATPEKPVFWPPAFLLHLAAALRCLIWEAQGFTFHIEAGLPEASDAIEDAFRPLSNPNAASTELPVRVLRIFIDRFAWTGHRDLGADMALDDFNDDAATGRARRVPLGLPSHWINDGR